jgi:hypothetical protein
VETEVCHAFDLSALDPVFCHDVAVSRYLERPQAVSNEHHVTDAQTRILAVSLVALTALLVGFQSVSTLLTVTQIGASPTKGPPPKSHASLVPQPPVATVKPGEPVSMPAPRASEPVPNEPAPNAGVTADARPMPSVPDNQVGAAAAAKVQAQAEMDAMGDQLEQNPPPRERRRRYRSPRPELHKVY